MNPEDLNHCYTPASLSQLNIELVELLDKSNDVEQFSKFKDIIFERDRIVLSVLSSLESNQRKLFAQEELRVNKILIDMAQRLLNSAKEDMTHFIRSQAAVKKYK